jgi:hypothetical protein
MFLDRLAIAALAWTSTRLCALYVPKPKPIPYAPARASSSVSSSSMSFGEDDAEPADDDETDVRAPDADLLRSMDLLEEGTQSW